MKLTMKKLAEQYSYDESTVRQVWTQKGLDMSWPEEQIRDWVRDNIIKPLRETDLREQMDRQKLLKLTAEAAMAELELEEQMDHIVGIDYLQSSLSEYFTQMKNYLRSMPNKHYLELFESQDALELKQKLSGFIDEALNEIGNQEYELPEERPQELTDENKPTETTEDTEQSQEDDTTAEETTTE
jgi:hypothetical protein